MDSLTKQQQECYEKIVKIKTNYKKDSESRKTASYVETRLERLETLWDEFVERDEVIQKMKQTNPQHAYFSSNYYEEVAKYYEALKNMLENKLREIESVKEQTNENNESSSYPDKMIRVQLETIKLLKRHLETVEREITEPRSSFYFQHKLNMLQAYWNKIMLNHTEIVANPNDSYKEYLNNKSYETLEDYFHKVVILMQEQMGSTQKTDEEVKLPRLILPVFEGDYLQWTAFHDIFARLIHNNTRLGDAEKMHYLKTHVKKEASSLIQHLTISNANYKTAWQLLKDRFDNKRKICSTQLQLLLSQPKLEQESANGIRKLYDTTRECLHALTNLGIDTNSWAPIITHVVIQKLDLESHKLYEQTLEKPKELPTNESLFQFLETRFQSLESLKDSKKKEVFSSQKPTKPVRPNNQTWYKAYISTTNKSIKCAFCQQAHLIYDCQQFLRSSIQDRRQFIRNNKLCFNCLRHNQNEKCRSRHTCSSCHQRHHSLLHLQEHKDVKSHPRPETNHTKPKQENNVQSLQGLSNTQVLLATALIKVRTIDGRSELLRALVDPGSQATFISAAAAESLALPLFRATAEVSGLGLAKAGKVRHRVMLELYPRFPSNFSITVEALVLPQLTKLLPNQKVEKGQTSFDFGNILLADPSFCTPGPIDIILGADIFTHIIGKDVIKNGMGLLAQQTEFGWILSGKTSSSEEKSNIVTSMISQVDLDNALRRFWEIEDPGPKSKHVGEEDIICEDHFMATHKRNADGTYTVRIPFKNNKNLLGKSRKRALARWLHNEKKFQSNKSLKSDYQAFIQEYARLKHMLPTQQNYSDGYYLPHQAVIKEDSTTTKLRVVFDASSKTSTGISLNDVMYTGPKLQTDLTNIILRWRQHRYVFTADIEKMYRQIKVHPEDQKYQKILWRRTERDPIQEYQLTTVTYGTAAAPFLAIRTLHQLAEDEKSKYPQAARVLLEDFYVDDMLTGTDTIREAKCLQHELINLLKSGGFKLRKWTTNQQSLLQNIPEEYREKNFLQISDGEPIKTLGLYWLPASDCFQFRVNWATQEAKTTKRSVLSDIAKIFDPTGWLAPIVIRAKIMMQELWTANLEWDNALPSILHQEWSQFKEELKTVECIKIPWWTKYGNNCQSLELHGFCDSSEKAYAAVIYTRVCTSQGDYITTMFTAKTKVAPLKKQTSLPRLELCAAVLLTTLLQKVKSTHNVDPKDIYLWTDSAIVLAWIRGSSGKLDTFVANRVSAILEATKPSVWNHVKSKDNPADCASRGIAPAKLKDHQLWWTGPKWLELSKDKWPKSAFCPIKILEPNLADNYLSVSLATTKQYCDIFNRFSSLFRLVRVLTYCRRFLKHGGIQGHLKTAELDQTLNRCLTTVQIESFPEEIRLLSQGKELPASSKLKSLTPFLDKDGLLRLGGRLEHALLSYNQKHPIILPHSHHITTLVIRDAHYQTLHSGKEATLAYIRRKYWVINAQTTVRRIIHRCIVCCRYRASTSTQLMGQLPAPRVRPSRPFTNTGIDYAGPFNLRMSKGRGAKSYKGYICIFVCLCTKAIHLEAVGDLTTDSFLAAYKRFTSRRGLCLNIYSDCATTFVGARNELEKDLKLAVKHFQIEAAPYMVNCGTQWHFIPPASPHFGGLWEAGVKSTKHHLRRIAGDVKYTFEEFSTLLAQIEACLNSRPLCPISSNPDDLMVLTPGHFLIGGPLVAPPEPPQSEKAINLLTRWKLVQKARNDFWKIWSTEYLTRLQQRNKWHTPVQNLKIGDIVLLKEDNLPPGRWMLGRIDATHSGADGLVRVATIKTAKGLIKRPITKICKLPFNPDDLPDPEPSKGQSTSCHYSTTALGQTLLTKDNSVSSPDPSNKATTGRSTSDPRNSAKTPLTPGNANKAPPAQKKTRRKIQPTNIPVRPPLEELRRTCLPSKRIKLSPLATSVLLLNCVLSVLSYKVAPKTVSDTLPPPVEILPFEYNPNLYGTYF